MLIDNKDALTAVDDCNYKIMSGYEWIRKQEIKKRLKEVPSAERKGKWVKTTEGEYCSNCKAFPYDDGEYHIIGWQSNYCPNCGARMVSE